VSNVACIVTDCFGDAIWWLVAEDADYRPPQSAFSCDNREHLMSAIGAILDELMVSAGAIKFQVSEEGFPSA